MRIKSLVLSYSSCNREADDVDDVRVGKVSFTIQS